MISFAAVVIGISMAIKCFIEREVGDAIGFAVPTVMLIIFIVLKLFGVEVVT